MKTTEDLDARDQHIADLARKNAEAIHTNILIGHEQTLTSIAKGVQERLIGKGVTELLARTARTYGALTAGRMLIDQIQQEIDADAERRAVAEVERDEAYNLAQPENCKPKTAAVARFLEHAA